MSVILYELMDRMNYEAKALELLWENINATKGITAFQSGNLGESIARTRYLLLRAAEQIDRSIEDGRIARDEAAQRATMTDGFPIPLLHNVKEIRDGILKGIVQICPPHGLSWMTANMPESEGIISHLDAGFFYRYTPTPPKGGTGKSDPNLDALRRVLSEETITKIHPPVFFAQFADFIGKGRLFLDQGSQMILILGGRAYRLQANGKVWERSQEATATIARPATQEEEQALSGSVILQ